MKHIILLISALFFMMLGGAEFPDASIVLMDDKESVVVNSDGTSVTTDRCVYKIMNYQGLLDLRTLQFHFNTSYGNIKVSHLVIVKPDGRRIVLEPEKLANVTTESSQMSSEIFDPAQKVMTITVPDLEIGDLLEVETIENETKSRIPGQWSDICVLQASFPIVNYEYTVSVPENKPLLGICIKDEVPGTVKHTRTVKNGRIIYSWQAKNVPQAIPETAMPAMYTCVQRVLVSTVKSWEDISIWYDKLCAPRLARVNEEMKKKTAELIAGKKNDEEKIMAIFQFVSQQIRYTGITDEDSAPGYEPHDVDKTFNQKHGVCRDKAALLVAMLRIAGFKAYPVLFMSGTPKDKEVANIFFNHAITGVEIAPGKYLLMDPTFETTTEFFPGYLAGFPYLVAKPEGETLRTAPPTPPEKNMLTVNTDAKMQSDSISVTTVIGHTGTYDQMYRDAFSTWTPDDVKNFLSAQIRKIAPGAELKKIQILPENIRDMDTPLQIKITYEVPGTLKNAEAQILQMPRGAMVFGLMDSLFTTTALKSRRFPLRAHPRMVKETLSLQLPPGVEVTTPDAIDIHEKGVFHVKGKFSQQNGVLKEEFLFSIESMLIAPSDYKKFKAAVSQAKNMWQTLPVAVKKDRFDDTAKSGANISFIKHDDHYIINDNHSWVRILNYKFKVLNYAGMKETANLSFNFVEGVEKVEFEAAVTHSDGKKFQLGPKDITYMDAPETAAASRYLKRKIAVVSLPGVAVNSIVDIKITKTTAKQPFFYAQLVSREDSPAKERKLVIEYPAKMPLKFSPVPAIFKDTSTLGGKRPVRTFSVTDMPRLAYEPGQPSYSIFVPTVRVSGGNYQQWSKEITSHAEAKAAQIPQGADALLAKILKNAPSAESLQDIFPSPAEKRDMLAKIFAVEKFVYKNIRLINLPLHNMYFEEYSLPQTTLTQAYGNHVDRAILMASLLKKLNVKYRFVAVATDARTTEENEIMHATPMKNLDKLILFLPEYNIYLNDSGLYGIPGNLRNGGAITSDEAALFMLIPQAFNNGIDCEIDLQKDNSAVITLKYKFNGSTHEAEAERFARFTAPLEKQHIETLAAGISPDAEIVEYKFTPEYALKNADLLLKVRVPNFAKVSGKFISFQLPEYSRFSNVLPLSSQPRKSPFAVNGIRGIFISYTIRTPENYTIVARNPMMMVQLPAVFAAVNYSQKADGEHAIDLFISARDVITPADDFPRMLELKGTIDHLNTKTVLFTVEQQP